MTPPIPPDAKRFRVGIIPGIIFVSTGGLGFGYPLGIALILIKHRFAVNWMSLLKVIAFSIPIVIPLILSLAFTWAFTMFLLFPSYVSSSGIHGHSFWGVRRFIAWSDIVRAKKFNLMNLAYICLYSASNASILWFPLFQSPHVEFVNEIVKFAPPNSPIRDHLR